MVHSRLSLLSLIIFLIISVNTYSDGCFVWRWNKKRDITEPSQKALIGYKNGVETLILQVKFSGTASEFGWLVPLPAKPTIKALEDSENPFPQLSYYNQKRRGRNENTGLKSGFGGIEKEGKTVVLEHSFKGVYETAILSSTSSQSLKEWLNTHNFQISEVGNAVLDDYIKRKWVFAAFKIRTGVDTLKLAKLKTGELQPISLRFKTAKPVYPMKISSINKGMTELQLYTLAEGGLKPISSGSLPNMLEQYEKPYWQKRSYLEDDERKKAYLKKIDTNIVHPNVLKNELPIAFKAVQANAWNNVRMFAYRAIILPKEMDSDLWFEFANIKENLKPYKIYPQKATAETEQEKKIKRFEQRYDRLKYSRSRYIGGLPINPNILDSLAKSDNKFSREIAASSYYLPQELLKLLSSDEDVTVRIAVASNPKTSPSLLDKMAEDKTIGVQSMVAKNIATPIKTIEKIVCEERLNNKKIPGPAINALYNDSAQIDAILIGIKSKHEYVRVAALSTHLKIGNKYLLPLLSDTSAKVRESLARRKDLDEYLYETLALDSNYRVREQVALNQNTPYEVLSKLTTDGNERVCKYAEGNKVYRERRRLQKLAKEGKRDVTWSTALTVEETKKRYTSMSVSTREQVAGTIVTPENILRILVKDTAVKVRKALTANPSTPKELINALAKDSSDLVRTSVYIHNKDLDEKLKLYIVQNETNLYRLRSISYETKSKDIITFLSKHENDKIRRAVAGNDDLPDNIRDMLLTDKSPLVRNYLVQRGMSWDQLQKFARDDDFVVAQNARKALLRAEEKFNKIIDWINKQ